MPSVVENKGNKSFVIDSVTIANDALGEFKLKAPVPTFVLPGAGQFKYLVTYTPSPAATGPSTVKLQVHGTNEYANNVVKSTVTEADVTGTGQKFASSAIIGTNGAPDNQFKVDIGSKVTVPVTLKDPIDVNDDDDEYHHHYHPPK